MLYVTVEYVALLMHIRVLWAQILISNLGTEIGFLEISVLFHSRKCQVSICTLL